MKFSENIQHISPNVKARDAFSPAKIIPVRRLSLRIFISGDCFFRPESVYY